MKLWLILAAAVALIGAAWGFVNYVVALQKAATTQAQAQTVQAQAQGQQNTQAAQIAAKEVIHEQTIQTTLPVVERRIAAAPGSDDYLDPRSADAFLDGVCQYRSSPDPGCGPQDPGGPHASGDLPASPGPVPEGQPGDGRTHPAKWPG